MIDRQATAADAALSVFGLGAQHDRLLRLHFPRNDGPDSILLPNRFSAHEESPAVSVSTSNSCRTTRAFP